MNQFAPKLHTPQEHTPRPYTTSLRGLRQPQGLSIKADSNRKVLAVCHTALRTQGHVDRLLNGSDSIYMQAYVSVLLRAYYDTLILTTMPTLKKQDTDSLLGSRNMYPIYKTSNTLLGDRIPVFLLGADGKIRA